MLKNILNLEGVQQLTKTEQQTLVGSTKVQPANCRCFCYNGTQKVSAYCFAYCPDGTIPGLYEGSTGNCTFPEI